MVRNTEDILYDALQLSTSERAALISRLMASLDPQIDEQIDAAWADETASRVREMDEGKVRMVAWDDVREKMKQVTGGQTNHPSTS